MQISQKDASDPADNPRMWGECSQSLPISIFWVFSVQSAGTLHVTLTKGQCNWGRNTDAHEIRTMIYFPKLQWALLKRISHTYTPWQPRWPGKKNQQQHEELLSARNGLDPLPKHWNSELSKQSWPAPPALSSLALPAINWMLADPAKKKKSQK